MSDLSVPDMFAEATRLNVLIDGALGDLRSAGIALATAERDYRLAKGKAWVRVLASIVNGTVPQREAWVNEHTSSERFARDLAEGERQAALEAVRSHRAQLSALQTMANAHREEAGLVRTGTAG